MFITLTFGWAPSVYIYCTLTGACSGCVRRLMVSPVFDWVDDICSGVTSASVGRLTFPQVWKTAAS